MLTAASLSSESLEKKHGRQSEFHITWVIWALHIFSCLQILPAPHTFINVNPLNAELNPICHLLALLGGATIVVVSGLKVNVSVNLQGAV